MGLIFLLSGVVGIIVGTISATSRSAVFEKVVREARTRTVEILGAPPNS